MSSSANTLNEPLLGSCFCGSIGYSLTSEPLLSAYCHCTNCQRLSGCPFVHTVHFPASQFSWIIPDYSPPSSPTFSPSPHSEPKHLSLLDTYSIPNRPHKTRFRCKNCGACVASYNSLKDTFSIWGAHLSRDGQGKIERWEVVKPSAHIFYGTRMVEVRDGLGKWEGYEGRSEKLDLE
ncbi:Mss4-like protein [Irpex rosettiformis]|uniref:Mss4-like protein n=1 Tax=Irpex rosettiformis TaxID=378272 RepID=A0ACB8TYL5_9APHY|nr:Mss4-like protein [Irpex rosettiformis]